MDRCSHRVLLRSFNNTKQKATIGEEGWRGRARGGKKKKKKLAHQRFKRGRMIYIKLRYILSEKQFYMFDFYFILNVYVNFSMKDYIGVFKVLLLFFFFLLFEKK